MEKQRERNRREIEEGQSLMQPSADAGEEDGKQMSQSYII